MIVRIATVADLPEVAAMHRWHVVYSKGLRGQNDFDWDTEMTRVVQWFADPNTAVIVAELEHGPVGFLHLSTGSYLGGGDCYRSEGMWVVEPWRKTVAARRMVAEARRLLRAKEPYRFQICVAPGNEHGEQIARLLGMHPMGMVYECEVNHGKRIPGRTNGEEASGRGEQPPGGDPGCACREPAVSAYPAAQSWSAGAAFDAHAGHRRNAQGEHGGGGS